MDDILDKQYYLDYRNACREGKLEEAQKLYNDNDILKYYKVHCFRDAIEYGHLDIVKWLYNISSKFFCFWKSWTLLISSQRSLIRRFSFDILCGKMVLIDNNFFLNKKKKLFKFIYDILQVSWLI